MSAQLGMNRELGTAWFTFYTKVRPILAFLIFLASIADFAQHYTIYFSHIGLLIAFVVSITEVVLSVMVAIKSDDDYGTFVRFVKGVLLFECFNIALQISIQQYYEFETTLLEVIIVACVLGLVSYFLWYRPNIKYFKKRLIQLPAVTQTSSSEILPKMNTIQAQSPATPNPQPKKATPVSKLPRKYCSHCGKGIDPDTKKCTGCGKQYFKGISWKVVFTTIFIILFVVSFAGNIILCFKNIDLNNTLAEVQSNAMTAKSLQKSNSNLQEEINELKADIADLKVTKSTLQNQVREYASEIDFYDEFVVFVEDDGTNLYHNYDCYKFKAESFWAFNIDAAKDEGYDPCSLCCN